MNCICGMYHEDQIKIRYFKHTYSAVIGCSVIYSKLIKTVIIIIYSDKSADAGKMSI